MTTDRLQAALSRALTRPKITTSDVEAFRRAVNDGGSVTPEELSALKDLATRYKDQFDPGATKRLGTLLKSLDPSTATVATPGTPATRGGAAAWDGFTVASGRDTIAGPEKDEGVETFDKLAPAVAAGTIDKDTQLLLASSASRLGVMGEAQAVRAVALLGALPAPDAAAFKGLLAQAKSPLEQAFLFKALGTGAPEKDVAAFADTIRGWPNPKLLQTLNLADPITDDGKQTGVLQQFHSTCVATTGQALRGEVDPIYALKVRSENTDIHKANDNDPQAVNPKLAAEQDAVVTKAGGWTSPRTWGGGGVSWDKIDSVYNDRSAQTGFTYSIVDFEKQPTVPLGDQLDLLARQLKQGIPTPVLVGVSFAPKAHAMISLAAEGSGPSQRFLLHDPWKGDTMWVTRQQLLDNQAPLGEFTSLGAIHLAKPAPAVPAPN